MIVNFLRHVRITLYVAIGVIAARPETVDAGELVLDNRSGAPLVCLVDGYTVATGWPFDWQITVPANQKFHVGPSAGRKAIDWATCGSLRTRRMTITPTGLDGVLVFNGQQTRVLNVLLYPYLPSSPSGNFQTLLAHVTETFLGTRPDVLLNPVISMDGAVDAYDFTKIQDLIGGTGFDVAEIDTVMLGSLVGAGLVTPAAITGDAPWPAAIQGSTVDGTLYGVPSWLCTEFAYAYSPDLPAVTSLGQFLAFLGGLPANRTRMVGDHDGSWTLLARYLQAYVGQYGYDQMNKGLTMPPDATVMQNVISMVKTCTNPQGGNLCIDGTYHDSPDGTPQKVFATGQADAVMGFSEQSFFILSGGGTTTGLKTTAIPWGPQPPPPVLYSDTFVTNKATCQASPCADDSKAFTTMMTGAAMKTYIAFSQDLPADSPPRRLLVATRPFWGQPQVQSDPLYSQFQAVLPQGKSYPNSFTNDQKKQISGQVCAYLKNTAGLTNYDCTPDTRPTAP